MGGIAQHSRGGIIATDDDIAFVSSYIKYIIIGLVNMGAITDAGSLVGNF